MFRPVLDRVFTERLEVIVPFAAIVLQALNAQFAPIGVEVSNLDRLTPGVDAVSNGNALDQSRLALLGLERVPAGVFGAPDEVHHIIRHVIVAVVALAVEPRYPVV